MKGYIEALGAKLSPYDARDYKGVAMSIKYPDEFELEMGKIKDQGMVGSCVAHSMAEIIEYFNRTQENSDIEMSVGYLYGNRTLTTNKGVGCYIRDILKVACKFGDVPYQLFPYNQEVPIIINRFESRNKDIDENAYPNRITSYFRLNNEPSIKSNLISNGPVIFAIKWFNDAYVENGKLVFKSKVEAGYHCMVIYGWNKEGWKIMNSWGKNFGNNGCAILPYDYKISEAWGVIDNNIHNNIDIIKPNKAKMCFARTINNVVNLFYK